MPNPNTRNPSSSLRICADKLCQWTISRETGKVPFVQINFGGYRVYQDYRLFTTVASPRC
jgi:hypothetical protein